MHENPVLSLVAQSCLTLCDTVDCSPPGSSVHGSLQARKREWVAMPSSRGSFQPRDRTQVSFYCRQILHHLSHPFWLERVAYPFARGTFWPRNRTGISYMRILSEYNSIYSTILYEIVTRPYFDNKGPSSQGYGFSSGHVWMWELDCEESWAPKNWCFWTVVLEKTLESPLDCKEIQPVHSEGDQPWLFFGGNDAKAETPVLWPPHVKSWLIGKDPDAGKDWGQEEKGTTEDEMAGWHHRLDGRESEWTPGAGDGQGGLACCDSWSRKESDMIERLNWTELIFLLHTLWTWPHQSYFYFEQLVIF